MDGEEHKLDSEEVKRLANQAKELKNDPAFIAAVLALRKQWYAQFMVSVDEANDRRLKAQLVALESIAGQLQVFINDHTWAEKRKH
jgi:hypothetical protein